MDVSDWNANPINNVKLADYTLSGPFGAIFAELMAQLKTKLDSIDSAVAAVSTEIGSWATATPARTTKVKAAIEAVEADVAALQASIGTWTDESETTTVKAAIEDLRPSGE